MTVGMEVSELRWEGRAGVSTEAPGWSQSCRKKKNKGPRLEHWEKPKGQGQIGTKKRTAGKHSHDVQRPSQVSPWYPAPKMGLKEEDQQG